MLKPLQERFADLSKNKDYIDGVIKGNAEKAQYFSNKTLRKVQKKVGFPEENQIKEEQFQRRSCRPFPFAGWGGSFLEMKSLIIWRK